MAELQRLRADHAAAVLAFELANRDYFAASISDRGDDYFEQFAQRHADLLADEHGAYHLMIDDGTVLGRFNLIFDGPETAVLGYRVAQAAAGRGLATAGVLAVCDLAAERYGVREIVAVTSLANVASQRVLTKAGFTRVGPAEPAEVGGKAGHRWVLTLTWPQSPRLRS